ncbi:MAG: ATP-binding protein [Desulfobacterales bacterium]|nr:ATP-binding protein [Desulfobacterales bacterium]
MTEPEKKLEMTEKQIALLQKGHQAVLEFIDKMEQMGQFQDKIDVPFDINQIWKVFLNDIQNLIDVEVCAFFLVDEDTNEFVLNSVSNRDKGYICEKEIDFQIESGIFSWIINRRNPAIIPSLVFKNKKTIIMLPLSTIRRTMGVVLALTPIKEGSITRESIKLLKMLAKQCSLVMENAFLHKNLRKKHESLQEAQAQIVQAEKLSSIGRMTSGACHEMLNPLHIISGYIQLLSMDRDLNPNLSKKLIAIQEQSERMAKIVRNLSQFSLKSTPSMGEVRINDLLENVLCLVEYEPKFDDIEIIKEFDQNLPPIMGDKEKLSPVFFNLLTNARDSMPQGGTLKISTGVLAGNNRLLGKFDFIEIKFQDTGCGIPDENINKIFDPFFTTKEAKDRTGLELSLSYRIIQDHGGTISVKSKVNKGTEFTICLPTAQAKAKIG